MSARQASCGGRATGTGAAIAGTIAVALLVACGVAGPAAADVTMTVAEEFPLRNAPVTITVDGRDPGTSYDLHVTYRPNSETAKEEKIGTIAAGAASGSIQWTPQDAGITSVRVMSGEEQLASKNIAVRFDKAPISGILVFLGAGFLLFGGATTAMRRALGG